MNTSEVLNKAADLIEERGWTQGVVGWTDYGTDEAAPLCLEGGIQAALGVSDRQGGFYACPAYIAVQRHLGLEGKGVTGFLWWWNDDQTAASHVIEVLRAAAVIEAAREDQDAAWATYAEVVSA